MIAKLIEERKLPAIPERKEILDILARCEYGFMPEVCGETQWNQVSEREVCCGKAKERLVDITFPTPDGESFTFRASLVIPNTATSDNKLPTMVFIAFDNKYYYPIEEIVDRGVIVAEIQYESVSKDSHGSFDQLMDAHYFKDGKREPYDSGKIGMWSFAASRTLDYLLTLDFVDKAHVGVLGHSRLGKTSLWAGANDERFTHVFSNDSGCSGAAIERGKIGERFPKIHESFGYWFSESFAESSKTTEQAETLSFDQHFLVATVAPRKVYVASASLDSWADPTSEYLSCVAASSAWEKAGKRGFVHPDRMPNANEAFADGDIGYHLREGGHSLGRFDWLAYVEFLKK